MGRLFDDPGGVPVLAPASEAQLIRAGTRGFRLQTHLGRSVFLISTSVAPPPGTPEETGLACLFGGGRPPPATGPYECGADDSPDEYDACAGPGC